MDAKDIFINFKQEHERQPKKLTNTLYIPKKTSKKKHLKRQNIALQDDISKGDCSFVCEYVELFVLGTNKKKSKKISN